MNKVKLGFMSVMMATIAGCGNGSDLTTDSGSAAHSASELTVALPELQDSDPIPADYVRTPGGWNHPSCVHEIPSGSTVNGDDVTLNGKLVEHFSPCLYPSKRVRSGSGGKENSRPKAPTAWGGWVEDTYQWATAGQAYFRYLVADIIVPPVPSTNSGQLLYYFPGIESSLDTNCGIIQPVLQYGVGYAGGGNYWAIASWWYINSSNIFHTPLSQVASGDDITATMSHVGANWLVQAHDRGPLNQEQSFTVGSTCRYNLAYPAVFEGNFDTCSQVPSTVRFYNIAMLSSTLASIPYAPTIEYPIGTAAPHCAWSISTTSTTATFVK